MFKRVTDFARDGGGDMYADALGLALTGDAPGIRQQVQLRLGFFRGEWFLDEDRGTPWFESVLVKNPDLVEVQDIFRTSILSVRGVREIQFLNLTYTGRRQAALDFKADTDEGELSFSSAQLPGG